MLTLKRNLTLCFNMGRRKHGKFPKNPQNTTPREDTRKNYNEIIRENEKFVEYYKKQNICPENEYDEFIKCMKTDLPATFRITGSKCVAKKMLDIVQDQLLKDCLKENEENQPKIFPLPWYPNKLAWQMELTRKDIRRNETYYKLHNFLIAETEHGTISRQETVSMIPPLVLDVQSHHKILDMCAAPGSKTAQLLELLHANDEPIPSGYVIANDIDNKRCYMLVHQAKRLNSPCIAIINHDSANLPNLRRTLADGGVENVKFDRILCDVPCSGDGTLRKNPDIWMKWTPANALNLHGVQMRILRRGIELLETDGLIVYSTCSLNPIENESVIHRILNELDGAVELVDVGKSLPGLKYSPGMQDWLVGSRNLDFYKTFEQVDDRWRTTIRPQMFPPAVEDREKFHLDRCVRILPHQQNTGAFFVAVMRKLRPLNAQHDGENEKMVEKKRAFDEKLPENQRKRRRNDGCYREDPFVFFNPDGNDDIWREIQKFYTISGDFNAKCLLTRCATGKKKNIYLTSDSIRDLVVQNQSQVKFINTGVKVFVRCDNKNMLCRFRIANDGLESIYPYIGDARKVQIPKNDLINLLMNDNPQKSPPITTLSPSVQKQCAILSPGSCVLIYVEENHGDDGDALVIHVSGWRGTTSLRCYMSQHSTVHLLRLLGGDISKFDVNKFKKSEEQEQLNAVEETDSVKEDI